MTIGILTASYITSSVLFILALGGLSNQEKAKRAVWYGIIGMVIAVVATIFGNQVFLTKWLHWLIGAIVIGLIFVLLIMKCVGSKKENDHQQLNKSKMYGSFYQMV